MQTILNEVGELPAYGSVDCAHVGVSYEIQL